MAKKDEDEMCCSGGCCGAGTGVTAVLLAAVLLSLGMIGGAYMLTKGDFAPNVNVGPTNPNIYVSSIPPDHAISVSATSTMDVTPDLLTMQVSVKTEDASAKKSQSDNAVVVADLMTKLKALGLKDEDIKTSSYGVDPVYKSTYVCDKLTGDCAYDYVITGYRTTQSLTLNVKDLTKGGDIIDASSTAGANQTFVDYVSFTLKDETRRALENSLLANASAEAKSKAAEIARGVGATLGKTLSVSESYSYYPTYDYRSYAMEAAGAPSPSTSLSSGQVQVSTSVSASFEVQ